MYNHIPPQPPRPPQQQPRGPPVATGPGQPPPTFWQHNHSLSHTQPPPGMPGHQLRHESTGALPTSFHFPKPEFSYPLGNSTNQHHYQHQYPSPMLAYQYPYANIGVPSLHAHTPPERLGLSLSQPPPPPRAPPQRADSITCVSSLTRIPRPPANKSASSLSSASSISITPTPVHHLTDKEPTETELRCKPCDKIFQSQKSFAAHVSTHDKCSECSFEATKKVVAAHYQSTHGTFSGNGYKQIEVEGLNFKVLMGTDPAEVAEWRNQRRRKFPTQQALEEKQTRERQLLEAGGLIGEAGTAKKDDEYGQHDKQDDVRAEEQHLKKRPLENILSSSGDVVKKVKRREDDPEVVNSGVESFSNAAPLESVGIRKSICAVFKRKGRCKFGDKCRFEHVLSSTLPRDDTTATKSRNKKNVNKNPPSEQMTSLYGKMVKNEIEKEDNIILQCFRFFVLADFVMTTAK